MKSIENVILGSLIFDERYMRQVLPHIDREYFNQPGQQVIFKLIGDHVNKYNSSPTLISLNAELSSQKLNDAIYKQAVAVVNDLGVDDVKFDWLIDSTEKFCKTQALFNAITKSAALLSKRDVDNYASMQEMIKDALSVSFDQQIGHDYLEDAEQRIDDYRSPKSKMKSDLQSFNAALRGGFLEKTLSVFLLPTGKGKSLIMCHFASAFIALGYNVLYITMEMPEKQVGGRIDANALNIDMEDLGHVDKLTFMAKIMKLQKKSMGKLIIKEYPAHTAHSGHFRHLINELNMKKNFKPDVVFVDYLGICRAASVSKDANSYERQKAVAEEIRGLGMEFNCRMFTAAQVNKEGTKAVDFGITDTAESWGIPATADYMFGGVITEEMERLGQMKIVRLKDRHNDVNRPSSFMIGIDRSHMRLFDIEADQVTDAAAQPGQQKEQDYATMDSTDMEMVFG